MIDYTRILSLLFSFACIFALHGQHVLTHEEPFHVSVLQQNGMRYLRLNATEGDTTAYHRHIYPILYMNLQAVRVWLESPGLKGRYALLEKGWIGSNSYSEAEPLVHRFAIDGASSMHLMAVECDECKPANGSSLQKMVYCRDGFGVYEVSPAEWLHCPYLSKWASISIESTHFPKGELILPGHLYDVACISDSRSKLWVVVPVEYDSCPN